MEYTLFSKDLLPLEEYEVEIEKYINNLGISEYEIIEKEQGNIPMTSYQFWKQNTKNIVHIGSAGGWTKASTGYTFKIRSKKRKRWFVFYQKKTTLQNTTKKINFGCMTCSFWMCSSEETIWDLTCFLRYSKMEIQP